MDEKRSRKNVYLEMRILKQTELQREERKAEDKTRKKEKKQIQY